MPGEKPAARPTDQTSHLSPAAPGPGALTVLIGGLPAWRTMLDTHICPATTPNPHGPEKIYMGSTTVLINDQMACRMADILQGAGPPNPVAIGEPTVVIGDAGFGMAKAEVKEAFADDGLELLRQWDFLTTDERLTEIERMLNRTRPPGMTLVLVQEVQLAPRDFGVFNYTNWSVDLNSDILNGKMDESRMSELLNTTYHEGRHSEQWWNVAQLRAGLGDSASQIQSLMSIPSEVAVDAAKHPVVGGTSEGVMGESVYTSAYGDRAAYREKVLSFADSESYDQYRALPEEEDAWRHGDDLESVFHTKCLTAGRSP